MNIEKCNLIFLKATKTWRFRAVTVYELMDTWNIGIFGNLIIEVSKDYGENEIRNLRKILYINNI